MTPDADDDALERIASHVERSGDGRRGGMANVTNRRRRVRSGQLSLDEALIALFIGAMNANDHVAPDEAERAHHLIWSTRRFRRKSGDTVGKLIQDMRTVVEESNARTVIGRATKAIPARLRLSAFAVVADLLLADGKLEAPERRFLRGLGSELKLDHDSARQIIDVVVLKNQL
ncbi:MAG: tellurite resistance TerB family protein [Vicinamibacterales bacterium]